MTRADLAAWLVRIDAELAVTRNARRRSRLLAARDIIVRRLMDDTKATAQIKAEADLEVYWNERKRSERGAEEAVAGSD
jgi:hypothetical protein